MHTAGGSLRLALTGCRLTATGRLRRSAR